MSLHLEKIRHALGGKAILHDVSLRVSPGEVLCLLGPSGCGKTTLLRLVAGLEKVQHGRIVIDNHTVADHGVQLPPEERGIGFVFQDLALFPHLSVLENVAFGLSGLRDKPARRSRALQALERVDMHAKADVFPHELSGGQQQRVALARALAPGPRIVLLDEPFSSLDARLRVQIRDQTLHVLKDSGVATVMVTHDPEEAMFMGDGIVLMNAGRVVQAGTPADLYCKPATPFVATFFSEVNSIAGTVRSGEVRTPWGPVRVLDRTDGTPVTLMFRPDSVQVSPERPEGVRPGVAATVLATRLLPGATVVHLRVAGNGGGFLHLRARVPYVSALPEGSRVSVHVPERLVHVFNGSSG